MGKLCIEVSSKDKVAFISEELCNGCGLCVKRYPFDAVRIVNIPSSLMGHTVHRYGSNGFKLHRLPQPRRGEVLGVVGSNGLGKSTAMKLLAGSLIPNFDSTTNSGDGGRGSDKITTDDPDKMSDELRSTRTKAVIKHFRGSTLQTYFTELYDGKLKTVIKPQYVDQIPKVVSGQVKDHITDEVLIKQFSLQVLLDKEVKHLSGGELQRFATAVSLAKEADVVIVDEPSSFLDIKQRIAMAANLRQYVAEHDNYMIAVEHDLAVLDYLSDNICVLTGD